MIRGGITLTQGGNHLESSYLPYLVVPSVLLIELGLNIHN